ncbi:MAG: hypothetical protein MSC30_03435 [Gaiellaceae bacterium MAG52_C11]|nr:hypothetical protein [Candidatus Gaiellasilicea maunaloa]
MEEWRPDEVGLIIDGIFEMNTRLTEISDHLGAIRAILEDAGGRRDEEED